MGDCQAVINNFEMGHIHAGKPSKRQASLWRELKFEVGDWREKLDVMKTKAHRNIEEILRAASRRSAAVSSTVHVREGGALVSVGIRGKAVP